MNTTKVIFFGSTSDSLIILKRLLTFQETTHQIELVAVVTQPPRPIGRKQIITPTPTETWAKDHQISVLSFQSSPEVSFLYADEQAVINTLETFRADLLISASYGQKIPTKTITDTRLGGINVHPSLLPRWRGPDPIPWQILSGDHQTGTTVVSLSEHMDEGKIISQKKVPLLATDQREPLRMKLFELGAELLVESLPGYIDGSLKGDLQDPKKAITAKRLKRDDGFIPWEVIQSAIIGETTEVNKLPKFLQQFANNFDTDKNMLPILCDRALRALSPWPGIWTEVSLKHQSTEKKRLKILSAHIQHSQWILDDVQLEGKTPTSFSTLKDNL